jgi:hypothetical protein
VIPRADIVAWRQVAPWADDAMVEQDLVLSRALVDVFSEAPLARAVALRGGTALHKLMLDSPGRYSEDIDLVQTEAGPIGSVLDAIRARLDPWLGAPTRDHAASSVTLLYRFDSEIPPWWVPPPRIDARERRERPVQGARPFSDCAPWLAGCSDR